MAAVSASSSTVPSASASPLVKATDPSVDEEFGPAAQAHGAGAPDYTVADPLGPISGFTNYSLPEMRVKRLWVDTLASLYQLYGFCPVFNRPVEYGINLQKTGGLSKQIYGVSRLQDGTLTKLGIPFDRTVPYARFLASEWRNLKFPLSRYDIDWSWRGEHAVASAARYRAFIQADVDTVAPKLTARADANCIVTLIKGLETLKVPNVVVYLNHIGVAHYFLERAGVPKELYKDALRVIDKLKPDNFDAVVAELCEKVAGMKSEQAAALLTSMSYKGPLGQFKFPSEPTPEAQGAFDHLLKIQAIALRMRVDPKTLEFCPLLARGLDYYTGVVFETFIRGQEKFGSVSSGGRYDDLVGEFDETVKLQGVGGSIGLTRLFDVMKALSLIDMHRQTSAQVFIGYRTEAEEETADLLATELRKHGIYCETEVVTMKVGKLLELVDGKGVPYAFLVMNPKEIILKDMRQKKTSADQTEQASFESIRAAANHMRGLQKAGKLDTPLALDRDEFDHKGDL